jgi:23S rRNA maturation mini-RNase III
MSKIWRFYLSDILKILSFWYFGDSIYLIFLRFYLSDILEILSIWYFGDSIYLIFWRFSSNSFYYKGIVKHQRYTSDHFGSLDILQWNEEQKTQLCKISDIFLIFWRFYLSDIFEILSIWYFGDSIYLIFWRFYLSDILEILSIWYFGDSNLRNIK